MDKAEIWNLRKKKVTIYNIAFRLGISVEDVLKVLYEDSRLVCKSKYKNFKPQNIKCLCCRKPFISENPKFTRICNKCKSEQEKDYGGFVEHIGYLT